MYWHFSPVINVLLCGCGLVPVWWMVCQRVFLSQLTLLSMAFEPVGFCDVQLDMLHDRHEKFLKCWWPPTILHSIICYKITIQIFISWKPRISLYHKFVFKSNLWYSSKFHGSMCLFSILWTFFSFVPATYYQWLHVTVNYSYSVSMWYPGGWMTGIGLLVETGILLFSSLFRIKLFVFNFALNNLLCNLMCTY
jgi:hypothetical protein